MRRYDLSVRFQLLRALRPSYNRDYKTLKRQFADTPSRALSQDHLLRLLKFVADHNRYYGEFVSERQQLSRLPILTKEIIREKFDLLQSTKRVSEVYDNSSGGSTGQPVRLVQDADYRRWSLGTQEYYFREFLNVEWNLVKNVWLWGSERDLMKLKSWRTRAGLFLRNRLMLNTFDTSDQRWLEYIERIRWYRPYFVAGYAGSLYQMARIARKYNIRLYRPRFVYSSAEMLPDFMRSEIEGQFNAKVYDFYGSREVGAIAGECSSGKKHVFIMNNIVEVVDEEDRTALHDQEGRIVITNLHNLSMPIVRYDIGDTGALSFDRCVCGSSLPVLRELSGRITDHFRARSGALVHGEYFTHLFYFRDWVNQFQVDQMDYGHIRISVVSENDSDAHDVAEINGRIRAVMGQDCTVEWRRVESIQKTAEGKRLYTRCLIRR